MSSEQPYPSRTRRHTVLWSVLIGILVIGAADQGYRLYLHRQVAQELDALKRAGYPTDLRALRSWRFAVPDKENAALGIMEAADFLALPPNSFSPDKWPSRSEELGPAERDQLGELLTNNAPALEAVHEAVRLKESRFPLDFNRGFNLSLSHLPKIKSLAQLLKAEAIMASEEGQPDKAVRSILDSVALARSLDAEPLFISQLVRLACLSISCSSLERLLAQHALSEPQLAALIAPVRDARNASSAASEGGVVGETCFGIYWFRSSPREWLGMNDNNSEASPLGHVLYPIYAWSGLRDRDCLFYLKMMHRMIQSAKSPFPERLDQANNLGLATDNAIRTDKLLVLSRMLLPALQRSTEKAAETEARLRCAEAALMIERSRAQSSGLLPTNILQWTGEKLPIDPFDGAPLRFQRLKPGYLLYSIGPDRSDDGGADRAKTARSGVRKMPPSGKEDKPENSRPRANSSNYDVTFAVER